jgi:hypothetical protein
MYIVHRTERMIQTKIQIKNCFATNTSTKPTSRKMRGRKYLQANTISTQQTDFSALEVKLSKDVTV